MPGKCLRDVALRRLAGCEMGLTLESEEGALKDKTFRRKTYLPKACNFHVQMPGTLNWRTKHARKKFTRCGLGAACWLRDGFDLGKRRRRSSTPAVVPGAAPALAKAGVGGYIYIYVIYILSMLYVGSFVKHW